MLNKMRTSYSAARKASNLTTVLILAPKLTNEFCVDVEPACWQLVVHLVFTWAKTPQVPIGVTTNVLACVVEVVEMVEVLVVVLEDVLVLVEDDVVETVVLVLVVVLGQ